jgi:hypothetical protein
MGALALATRYRPLRLGWCVRNGNLEQFRKVLRLTHTLWGGRYNPVIPVDDTSLAKQLVRIFQLDVLYPAEEDDMINVFIKKFSFLPWPLLHKDLYIGDSKRKSATLLDIQHPVHRSYEELLKSELHPEISYFSLIEWDSNDPMADVFLATFGSFPSKVDIGIDYFTLIEQYFLVQKIVINVNKPVPDNLYEHFTPSNITAYDLRGGRPLGWEVPGFYVGDAQDFNDLGNFWNLRAANIDLLFYDPNYATRENALKDSFVKTLSEAKGRSRFTRFKDRIAIWSKSGGSKVDIAPFGKNVIRCSVTPSTWNGLNVKPRPIHFDEQTILGFLTDESMIPQLSFQLPQKPFFDDIQFHSQHVVISPRPLGEIDREGATFFVPFIPELNEYYGQEIYLYHNRVRSEVDGLGVITEVTRKHLTLNALSTQNLIEKIFEVFGMKAETSRPGLIARQLIRQMGGIQGCRVFKIAGVRKLIEKYSPDKWFNRSDAIVTIGQNDPRTGRPNFLNYESLFIDSQQKGKLKPENAFTYLVKKEVFRVGLIFDCPACHLPFWLHLDDVTTEVNCVFCGNKFNTTHQLRDRDWKYRRSGLFGQKDHQEGAIPVVLTLQQLVTNLAPRLTIYTTAMEIKPIKALIDPCEIDFIIMTVGLNERVQLAIGECKANEEISEEEVTRLKDVADAFPNESFDVFIIFSKTSSFKDEEIRRFQLAQDQYRSRIILLSSRELESYHIYERTSQEFQIDSRASCLEDLAQATNDVYFSPKPIKNQI